MVYLILNPKYLYLLYYCIKNFYLLVFLKCNPNNIDIKNYINQLNFNTKAVYLPNKLDKF